MFIKGHEIHITTSIGASLYPTYATNVEHLYKKADLNLYKSKDCG